MAKRKKPQGLAAHPQLQKIIDAYLAGQSPRQIASWCKPAVSHTAIWNYGKNVIEPTMQRAEELQTLVPPNKMPGQPDLTPEERREQAEHLTKEVIVSAPVLASRQNRLAAIQERHDRLAQVMKERGEELADVPGGKSGLLVRDFKGDNEVFKLDATLLSEFREHERHMAIELGQWQEAPTQQFAIQIVMPQSVAPADPAQNCQVVEIALPTRPNR